MDQLQPTSGNGVIAGGTGLPLLKKRRNLMILGGALLVALIFGGVIIYALVGNQPHKEQITCRGQLSDDYDVMSEQDIYCKLKSETGLDVRDLMNKRIKGSTFKSFNEAEASARALYGMGKWHKETYQKAVDAYKVAESKASGNDATYEFYLQYAYAALVVDDKNLNNALTEKAKTAIKNDSKLSAAEKTRQLQIIDADKRIRERDE